MNKIFAVLVILVGIILFFLRQTQQSSPSKTSTAPPLQTSAMKQYQPSLKSDGTQTCTIGRGKIPIFPTQDELSGSIDHIDGIPDIHWFYENYILHSRPAIIHGATSHWPALSKWKNDLYLKSRIGSRYVKVERSLTHEFGHWANEVTKGQSDWGFWNVTFAKFIDEMIYLNSNNGEEPSSNSPHWYLDSELPTELGSDVSPAQYIPCMLDRPRPPYWRYFNVWMGGGLENSLLHNDLEDNLLQVIVGYKRVTLIDPMTPSEYLYEIFDFNETETKLSPVNTENVDYLQYPLFKNVKTIKLVLKAGDVLYIPAFWWHQVRSFCRHISVNVWFDFFDYKAMDLNWIYSHPTNECVKRLRTHSPLCKNF